MKLYDEHGYVNFRAVRDCGMPFVFLIGGRATGKTYGGFRSSIEDSVKFLYMRRTQTQLEIVNKPQFSPVKPVARDMQLQITMRPVAKGISAYVPYELDEKGNQQICGDPYGYNCALSTVSNLRGFDASEIQLIMYDEFIAEKNERPIKNEADALFNAYETFNRNRELQGVKPITLVCMANANDQTAPVLESLGLVKRIEKMRQRNTEIFTDPQRGIALFMLRDSPVSRAKAKTALYKLTEGSSFAEMSLDNSFAYEDRAGIISQDLRQYKPLASIGGITVYKHKSHDIYYISAHKSGSPVTYTTSDIDIARFADSFDYLYDKYIADKILFEDFAVKAEFNRYI